MSRDLSWQDLLISRASWGRARCLIPDWPGWCARGFFGSCSGLSLAGLLQCVHVCLYSCFLFLSLSFFLYLFRLSALFSPPLSVSFPLSLLHPFSLDLCALVLWLSLLGWKACLSLVFVRYMCVSCGCVADPAPPPVVYVIATYFSS